MSPASAVTHQPAEPVALQAARELDDARLASMGAAGGCGVLEAVNVCAVHGLPMPQWLRDDFIRRYSMVTGARALSWDDAFDSYWPKGTRLSTERKKLVMTARVHASAWALLRCDPRRPINRDLFEEVGESRDVSMSGSAAEKLYYLAIEQGALNLAAWRRSELAAEGESLDIGAK